MWLEIALVVVGLALILAGANFLTDGAAAIARRFKIPQLIIGLTIVAFGTSAPELSVSVLSSIGGNGGIAVGNVIGSNIFNILLTLGLCAVVYPIPVQRNSIRFDIPISILAATVMMIFVSDPALDGAPSSISRAEALILILFGLLFLGYTMYMGRQNREETEVPAEREKHWALNVLLIIVGLAGLIYGGGLFVDNASLIAKKLGVSDTLIGLTLVAWGTSAPELATSVVAALKKNTGIAVGNVIGSNIFNIFFVLGISGVVHPLQHLQFTTLDIWMQLIATIMAFAMALFWGKREIKRPEGLIMLLLFIAYNAVLITNSI
ncbi:calcium/sodium antiporter [Porphyromonas levii]|uniref:calcium/sodium antiporter n=1 Tax=Porphyromonas levii TaxID=28114 RepID=UPI001B8AFF04|nr:calcium/sodium antiporter [Porphyromonas levii]MBR8768830.1 Inner membrane protein YrbG [Porphyromonas levii]